jgi:hypothetical protein
MMHYFINQCYAKYGIVFLKDNSLETISKHVMQNNEINWYPFFWDGFEPINRTFVKEKKYVKSDGLFKTIGKFFRPVLRFVANFIPLKSWRHKIRDLCK